MAFTVEIATTAYRLAKKLPQDVRKVIVEYTEELAKQPLAGEKLKGQFSCLYSYHFSHKGVAYRLIYEVSTVKQQILIRLVATRENIYRRLGEMKIKPLLVN
jgi:mRNA-degrading endonuclease RelE of RelBE toxin-antitoxin system